MVGHAHRRRQRLDHHHASTWPPSSRRWACSTSRAAPRASATTARPSRTSSAVRSSGNTGFAELGTGRDPRPQQLDLDHGVVAVVAYVVTTRTPFGRHVYAIGGNERSAQLSGVPISAPRCIVYMISGFCAAMVGPDHLRASSWPRTRRPGNLMELNAIAAVVLGGTSLSGGRGTSSARSSAPSSSACSRSASTSWASRRSGSRSSRAS